MSEQDWKAGLSAQLQDLADYIRALALRYPETVEDLPWGHPAIKVRGKSFLFMGSDDEALRFSVKLPSSHPFALDLPFATPTRYGLGRSHWVTFRLESAQDLDRAHVARWLDESFRANAPKSLLKASEKESAVSPGDLRRSASGR